MALCTANFEGGVNGATIATSDPGFNTPWDIVSIGSGNALTYDGTNSPDGHNSAKIAMGNTSGSNSLSWTSGTVGSITDYYGRVCVYLLNYPTGGGSAEIIGLSQTAGRCWGLRIDSTGHILVGNAAFATIYTFSNAIPLGQWIRTEFHIDHGTGAVEVKYAPNVYSAGFVESTSLTGQTLRASADTANFGSYTLNGTMNLDAIVLGASSYPGPIIDTTPIPKITIPTQSAGRW